MKDIKLSLLKKATSWLVGGELFNFIQKEVELMMDADMSGSAKRNAVMREAQAFFSSALKIFISIAIEVAVAFIKNKAGQLEARS